MLAPPPPTPSPPLPRGCRSQGCGRPHLDLPVGAVDLPNLELSVSTIIVALTEPLATDLLQSPKLLDPMLLRRRRIRRAQGPRLHRTRHHSGEWREVGSSGH
ncbi:hypothetical protein E2562_037771 [Oryza meyeriana var. granulata]|uniref:Uncharacterized protein n=1 Tax=Oryza meyeriana var. granulata TaxID=110450 RepID=A0A6G1C0U3_9ORYZ|nr:hypothetical protein E2562_037771 [Oryza meyeriana var. granulata]